MARKPSPRRCLRVGICVGEVYCTRSHLVPFAGADQDPCSVDGHHHREEDASAACPRSQLRVCDGRLDCLARRGHRYVDSVPRPGSRSAVGCLDNRAGRNPRRVSYPPTCLALRSRTVCARSATIPATLTLVLQPKFSMSGRYMPIRKPSLPGAQTRNGEKTDRARDGPTRAGEGISPGTCQRGRGAYAVFAAQDREHMATDAGRSADRARRERSVAGRTAQG